MAQRTQKSSLFPRLLGCRQGYTSGVTRGQSSTGRGVEEGRKPPSPLWGHLPPSTSLGSATWKLIEAHQKPTFRHFVEASLHTHSGLNHSSLEIHPTFKPLPFPKIKVRKRVWKILTRQSLTSLPGYQAPLLELPKVPL